MLRITVGTLFLTTLAQAYTVTHVAGLPGARDVYVQGVNDNGDVVGICDMPNGDWRGFIWQEGVTSDLGSFGGGSTWASDLNNSGQVVGISEDAFGTPQAFLWTRKDGMRRLLGSRDGNRAYGINERGVVVGGVSGEAFVWMNGVTTYLPHNYPLSYGVQANGINELGKIVGTEGRNMSEFWHPVSWHRGQGSILSGGEGYSPRVINNAGQIVGIRWFFHDFAIAVTWLDGLLIHLPRLGGEGSEAGDIDERGQIVGYSLDPDYVSHAVIWRNLEVTDLNTLIPKGSGWYLLDAGGINESGQIAGKGTFDGVRTGYLLTPVNRRP